MDAMSATIELELEKAGDVEACKLWRIHHENLNKHFVNGGKSRGTPVPVDPVMLNWAIAFLAKTSSSIYKEVAKIMVLPDISYVYRNSTKLISHASITGYSLHITTIKNIRNGWKMRDEANIINEDAFPTTSQTLTPGLNTITSRILSLQNHCCIEW